MKSNWIWMAALVAPWALSGCGDSANGKTPDDKAAEAIAIPVEVRAPTRGEMLAIYTGTATLEADREASVVAKVGGEVRALLTEEGELVRAGQVLARLDGDQLRLEAEKAKATLAKLEHDYRRNVELHEKGLLAPGAFENLKYEVDNQQAAYDLARLQLSYTEIRAPFDGVLSQRMVKVGNTISPTTYSFASPISSPCSGTCMCPSANSGASSPDSRRASRSTPCPHSFIGTVARISPTVDPATATFKVTIEVADPSKRLKPGMFARIGIVFERREGALQIPRIAIVDNEDGPTVFVVEKDKADQRPIQIGLANAGFVEVISGLKGDEQVVVVGQNGLKNGNPVRVVSLEPPRQG